MLGRELPAVAGLEGPAVKGRTRPVLRRTPLAVAGLLLTMDSMAAEAAAARPAAAALSICPSAVLGLLECLELQVDGVPGRDDV